MDDVGGIFRYKVLCCLSVALFFCLSSANIRAHDSENNPSDSLPQATQDDSRIRPVLPPSDTAQQIPSAGPEQDIQALLGPNYVLGPEDVLKIDVFNVPELSKMTVRVSNDGMISLPLLGQVKAAGLTTEQLRKELEEKWGDSYLQDPQIDVYVSDFKAKPVSVIGAVDKPGLYPLTGKRTLIEMLSMAGGLGKRGTSPAGRMVLVTRRGGFGDLQPVDGMHMRGSDQLEIDLQRLLYTRDEGLNIDMKSLDIISVTRAEVVYAVGAVNRPGGFVLDDRPNITVLQLLAMAEGVTGSAAKRKARIYRTSKDGSRVEVPLDLGKILKGKSNDISLASNDILFVPNSSSKAAGRRATDAAVGTLTGWLVWRR
jgi:polysaccharide export outer membrane protein